MYPSPRTHPAVPDTPAGEEVVDLVLSLPARQLAALEGLARRRGMTIGVLLRVLVGAALRAQAPDESDRGRPGPG